MYVHEVIYVFDLAQFNFVSNVAMYGHVISAQKTKARYELLCSVLNVMCV